MLKIGKKYWFRIQGTSKEVNIKGEVIEENDFMCKILRDNGNEEILSFRQIINVNEEKEQLFTANEQNVTIEKIK